MALLSALAVGGMVAVVVLAIIYFGWSLTFDLKEVGKIPERSWVYDMDGKVYSFESSLLIRRIRSLDFISTEFISVPAFTALKRQAGLISESHPPN